MVEFRNRSNLVAMSSEAVVVNRLYKRAPELAVKEDRSAQNLEAIAERLQQEASDYNYGIDPL